jgi:hypothetical protein
MSDSINTSTVTNTICTETKFLLFSCPQCRELVQVETNQLNCGIFRHAVYHDTMQLVDPHLPKEICELLVRENKVFGCCKPFQIKQSISIQGDPIYALQCCDYI